MAAFTIVVGLGVFVGIAVLDAVGVVVGVLVAIDVFVAYIANVAATAVARCCASSVAVASKSGVLEGRLVKVAAIAAIMRWATAVWVAIWFGVPAASGVVLDVATKAAWIVAADTVAFVSAIEVDVNLIASSSGGTAGGVANRGSGVATADAATRG